MVLKSSNQPQWIQSLLPVFVTLFLQALRDNIDSQMDVVDVMRKAGNEMIEASSPSDPHVRVRLKFLLWQYLYLYWLLYKLGVYSHYKPETVISCKQQPYQHKETISKLQCCVRCNLIRLQHETLPNISSRWMWDKWFLFMSFVSCTRNVNYIEIDRS